MITPSSNSIPPGEAFTAKYLYNSFGATATVTWYLDPDTNPYNNNSIALGTSTTLAATGDGPVSKTASLTANASDGNYYLEGVIDGAAGTRYQYSVAALVIGNKPPIGLLDKPGTNTVTGWAIDPDAKATPLTVRIDVDGVTFATTTANINRKEIVKTYGNGKHGFSFNTASLPAGIHRVDIYANDSTDGTPTLIATQTIYSNHPPTGKYLTFNGSILTGWAFDPDSGATPSQILYTVDNGAPVKVTASVIRPELQKTLGSTDHGFVIGLPQLMAGKHTVTVYAIDSTTDALTLLGTKSVTIKGPTGNPLPQGAIEVASPTLIQGWAYDSSVAQTSMSVRIDIDGVPGVPFVANVQRNDLNKKLGYSFVGYSQLLSLLPGEHRIDVYGIDYPAALPCCWDAHRRQAPRPPPSKALETVNQTQLAGWAYSSATPNAALVRLDIDGLDGTPFLTNVPRPDINTNLSVNGGTLGLVIATPQLAPGMHTVTLSLIDPMTLAATLLSTQTLLTS